MLDFTVNTVIEWVTDDQRRNVVERILWLDTENDRAVVISLSEPKALPVFREISTIEKSLKEGTAIKRLKDPYAKLVVPESRMLEKHRHRRDRAWSVIEKIVKDEPNIYDPELRSAMIAEISGETGTTRTTIYRYLRKYWIGGKTKNALLPNYDRCGRPLRPRKISEKKLGRPSRLSKLDQKYQGVNVDETIRFWFEYAIKHYYDTRQKAPLRRAYERMIENHFNIGYQIVHGDVVPTLPPEWELPKFGQFKYWFYKTQNLKRSLIAREGEKGFNLRHRAVLGSSTQMAMGPGSIFQIDATIADVYLVHHLIRDRIIGRPVIYCVVDVFSRMIVGLYVGVEGPNWLGASMALANACEDKTAFCAEYGIELQPGEWDCRYLPEKILGDRGELIGKNAEHLAEGLDIYVANTPPYRADWKGIVEQKFRQINARTIHWLPGAIKERFRERGEPDHRLDAVLDLHQFTKIMIYTVIQYNLHHRMDWYPKDEFMIEQHVEPIPAVLWQWGIENRSGHLREPSRDLVRLHLMPRDQATVTSRGIQFQGRYYTCERALQEQWFERARARGRWTLPVSYDFRKVDTIYLSLNGGKTVEPCHLLDKDKRFSGWRVEEVLEYFELEKENSALHRTAELQSVAELDAHVDAIVSEALRQRKEAGVDHLPKSQRLKGIRANKSDAKKEIRQKQAWELKADEPVKPNREPVSVNSFEEEFTPKSKQQAFLELLKNQREGK